MEMATLTQANGRNGGAGIELEVFEGGHDIAMIVIYL
jgi:hypothetical protein